MGEIDAKDRIWIARILKNEMALKGITKADLVKKTGLSRGTVYTVLQDGGNDNNYTIDNLLKVARAIGLKVAFK